MGHYLMSSIGVGRQKRPLFSGQKAFKQFIVDEVKVIPPVPQKTLLHKLLYALALTILTSGTTFVGIWTRNYIISYVGIICMIFVIIWFIYSI